MSNRSALTELVSRAGMIGRPALRNETLTRVHASYTPANGFSVLCCAHSFYGLHSGTQADMPLMHLPSSNSSIIKSAFPLFRSGNALKMIS